MCARLMDKLVLLSYQLSVRETERKSMKKTERMKGKERQRGQEREIVRYITKNVVPTVIELGALGSLI